MFSSVGAIVQNNLRLKDIMLEWSLEENIWVRRVSICYQLSLKENTDTDILEKTIVNNLDESEFFINKGIGWALREYSKTNSKWVLNFILKYKEKLSKLSIREGSKYIK